MGIKSLLTFLNSRAYAILIALILLDLIFLLFYSTQLSISKEEADLYFNSGGYLAKILHTSTAIFGQTNLGLRVPFVALHTLNLIVLTLVARDYVRKPVDVLLAVGIFMLLPGVNSMALLVSKAGFATLTTLLFIYTHKRNRYISYALLFVAIFFYHSLFLLAFAYFIYAIYQKDRISMIVGAALATLAVVLYGLDIGGRPRGYFLNIFGIYGAIFTPFIFLFYIYTIYFFIFRYKERLTLLWFASSVPFLLSILLSIRQYIPLDEYGAYAVIATPLMAISFMNSYRLRLPENRALHGFLLRTVMITLLGVTAISFFNKPIYGFLERPQKHFAYQFHFGKPLADELKKRGINAVVTNDAELKRVLKFYGIAKGGEWVLTTHKPKENYQKIEFVEYGKVVFVRYLTKR